MEKLFVACCSKFKIVLCNLKITGDLKLPERETEVAVPEGGLDDMNHEIASGEDFS